MIGFLHNEYLYILTKKIYLSFDHFIGKKSNTYKIFVDEACIYVGFSEHVSVFNHDGEFIRRIVKPYPNCTFYIDLDKIYVIKESKNLIELLIYQQNTKKLKKNKNKN